MPVGIKGIKVTLVHIAQPTDHGFLEHLEHGHVEPCVFLPTSTDARCLITKAKEKKKSFP